MKQFMLENEEIAKEVKELFFISRTFELYRGVLIENPTE